MRRFEADREAEGFVGFFGLFDEVLPEGSVSEGGVGILLCVMGNRFVPVSLVAGLARASAPGIEVFLGQAASLDLDSEFTCKGGEVAVLS